MLNWAPTSTVKDKTPEEAWSSKKSTIEHFWVFGCDAYAHVSDEKRTKLDSKSVKCIFLGYYEGTKCYRLFNPETKKIVKSRDVKFVEVTESKEKEGIDEVNNEPLTHNVKVNTLRTPHPNLKLKVRKKWEIQFIQLVSVHFLLNIFVQRHAKFHKLKS